MKQIATQEDLRFDNLLNSLTKTQRIYLALGIIRSQFPVDIPAGKLMFAIIEQAIRDSMFIPTYLEDLEFIKSGRKYLRGEIIHGAICGVRADWIRFVITRFGINISKNSGMPSASDLKPRKKAAKSPRGCEKGVTNV